MGTATAIIVAPAATGITVDGLGAVLNVDNGTTLPRPVQLTGTGIASGGALINGTSGNTSTLNGGVTLTGTASIGGAGNLNFTTAAIGDGGGGFTLTKVGAGIVTYSFPNTYTGQTLVAGGTLRIAGAANLPTGNINLNGGALEPTYNYTGTVGTGAGQVQLTGGTSGFSAGVAPGITVNLNNTATLQWGSATFNPGSLLLNQTSALGTIDFQNPLDLNGAVRSFTNNSTTIANVAVVSGAITNSSGTAAGININGTTGTGAGIIQFTNPGNTGIASIVLNGGELSYLTDSNIGGTTSSINFNGGGLQVLGTTVTGFGSHPVTFTAGKNIQLDINNAANTFTVGTTPALVAGQTLTKLGAGTLVLSAPTNTVTTLNMNGGTLDLGATTLNLSNSGGTTLTGTANSTINATGGGKLVLSTAGGTNYADNSVSSGVTLVINAKVSGAAAGAGFEYCCTAGGTIALTNSANDFTGDVLYSAAATISVPAIGLKNAASPLGLGTTITFNGGAGSRLLYTGPGETTDRILALANSATLDQSGTGLLKFSTAPSMTGANVKTLTLQGSTAGAGEISGVIADNSATNKTSISKAGTGTWVLSGANTFTGTLGVTAGTLQLAANPGNITAGVSSAAGANTAARLSLANATMLQLRSDSTVTFGGTDAIGALNGAVVGIDVNQLTSTGTNNVLTISPGTATPIGNAVTLNVTGGNGYSLGFGTIQSVTGAATNLTLNPTTANMSLVGYSNQNNTTNSSTLTLSGTGTTNSITGVVANQGTGSTGTTGTVAVVKTGTSTWNLGGTNTYTGTTTISNGLLRVTGSLAAGTATTVSAGGGLGGTGTVNGAVSASSGGGNIDLRDGAVGTLTLGSTLTLGGAAATPNSLYFDLGNGAAGTDKVVAAGAVGVTNTGGAVIYLNQLPGTTGQPGHVHPPLRRLRQRGQRAVRPGHHRRRREYLRAAKQRVRRPGARATGRDHRPDRARRGRLGRDHGRQLDDGRQLVHDPHQQHPDRRRPGRRVERHVPHHHPDPRHADHDAGRRFRDQQPDVRRRLVRVDDRRQQHADDRRHRGQREHGRQRHHRLGRGRHPHHLRQGGPRGQPDLDRRAGQRRQHGQPRRQRGGQRFRRRVRPDQGGHRQPDARRHAQLQRPDGRLGRHPAADQHRLRRRRQHRERPVHRPAGRLPAGQLPRHRQRDQWTDRGAEQRPGNLGRYPQRRHPTARPGRRRHVGVIQHQVPDHPEHQQPPLPARLLRRRPGRQPDDDDGPGDDHGGHAVYEQPRHRAQLQRRRRHAGVLQRAGLQQFVHAPGDRVVLGRERRQLRLPERRPTTPRSCISITSWSS